MGTRLKVNIVYAKKHQQHFVDSTIVSFTVRRMSTMGPSDSLKITRHLGFTYIYGGLWIMLLLTILSAFNDNL